MKIRKKSVILQYIYIYSRRCVTAGSKFFNKPILIRLALNIRKIDYKARTDTGDSTRKDIAARTAETIIPKQNKIY